MITEVIDSILELETLGYVFKVEGNKINYSYQGTSSDPAVVRPLMRIINKNRDVALEWLRDYADVFRVDCLFNAAERAEAGARQAERAGDLVLVRFHWKRFARFFAAGAESAGATDPYIPWDEWIRSFDDEMVQIYDREPELQLQE